MLTDKDFVTQEVGKVLAQFKTFENCPYKYATKTEIADNVLLMHPGLSDSGYMDLLKEYGGKLERDELYKTYIGIVKYPIGDYICPAPTLYDVQTWLRLMHKVYLHVEHDGYHDMYRFVFTYEHPRTNITSACYKEYEEAFNAGIMECIHHCKNRNVLNKEDYVTEP